MEGTFDEPLNTIIYDRKENNGGDEPIWGILYIYIGIIYMYIYKEISQ
jgi:hypothetical protein